MMHFENDESDSETELQEAFSQGIIKPGLNIEETPKIFTNNEVSVIRVLNNFTLNLPWIEKVDLNSKPAALAPELAAKLEEEKEKQAKVGKVYNPVFNDFERETMFLRQAQAAVLEGIARLKELGIPTKRPDDYFAEMAKSDNHMQKVRTFLQKRKLAIERSEKVKHIRKMRKVSKDMQKQAKVQKINEKREFLDQVKKYRDKMTTNLDFLDAKPKPKPAPVIKEKKVNRKVQAKQKYKNEKYGMGGKKKGNKRNTKESFLDTSQRKPSRGHAGKGGKGGKGGKKVQRPGKSKRMQKKSGKKH